MKDREKIEQGGKRYFSFLKKIGYTRKVMTPTTFTLIELSNLKGDDFIVRATRELLSNEDSHD